MLEMQMEENTVKRCIGTLRGLSQRSVRRKKKDGEESDGCRGGDYIEGCDIRDEDGGNIQGRYMC